MNVVGAIGWSIMGIALFVNKLGEQSAGVLATIVAIYAVVVSVPSGTALAISKAGRVRLQQSMLWANGLLIGFWCLSLVSVVLIRQTVGVALLGALFFVVPQAINIRALRALLQS